MSKLADLAFGASRLKAVSFKRTRQDGTVVDAHLKIRLLTKIEMDEARVNARATVLSRDKDLKEGRAFDELLEDSRVVEILAIACRDSEKPDEPWSSPYEIERTLTPPEIAMLFELYSEHQAECGPILHDLTTEQFETLLEAIAKEGSADPFLFCASPLRNAFIISTAKELLSLRMASSSRSSASTESSDSESSSSASMSAASRDLHEEIDVLIGQIADLTVRVHDLETAGGTT